MTKEDGETVVGWEIPGTRSAEVRHSIYITRTLRDLLSSVDLCNLLLQELVALLADAHDLVTLDAQRGDGLKDLLGDLGGSLVLGESIWVGEGVVWNRMISLSLGSVL